MIHFRNNVGKSLEVILWFANQRPGIDFHAILKLLFFADKRHLNEFGRPIVGGEYRALTYGPVSQPTYDILKGEPLAMEALQVGEDAPFEVRNRFRVHPNRLPNLDKLSRSDVAALEAIWAEYNGQGFDALTKQSHEHPAYRNAEMAGRYRMAYADFLEGDNATPEVIADLEATSSRIRV